MKVISSVPPAVFQPVSLTLRFETQDELNAFFALMNCSAVVRVPEKYGINHEQIRNVLRDVVDEDASNAIHNEIVNHIKAYFKEYF